MVRGIVLGLGRSLALYITSEALGRLLLRPNHGHNVESNSGFECDVLKLPGTIFVLNRAIQVSFCIALIGTDSPARREVY
jgi:hypothetical protein